MQIPPVSAKRYQSGNGLSTINTSLVIYRLGNSPDNQGMDINSVRRQNVRALIHFAGGPTALADRINKPQNLVSRWAGNKPLGNKAARDIETPLGLHLGWMDQPHPNLWALMDEPQTKGTIDEVLRMSPPLVTAERSGAEIQLIGPEEYLPSQVTPGSVSIPVLDAPSSMGRGLPAPEHDVVLGYMILAEHWVRKQVDFTNIKNLRVITAYGSSMEPTFSDGDILMVDVGVTEIKIDAIYVLAWQDELLIKRIERRIDGSLTIKGDNPASDAYQISRKDLDMVRIIGRVVWAWNGRKL